MDEIKLTTVELIDILERVRSKMRGIEKAQERDASFEQYILDAINRTLLAVRDEIVEQ